jgi:hypothetical protein
MLITKHDECYIVELSDSSAWRVWPADMADTLQWLPTTEIEVTEIDDKNMLARSHQSIRRITSAGDQGE